MFDREITVRGKYAAYLKSLCQLPGNVSDKDKALYHNFKIFETYVGAYMVAPIIGLLNGKKASYEVNDDSKESAGILEGVLIKNASKLKYIYRLIILSDDSEALSDEEKINRAFREDDNEESVKRGMELYTAYFLGGLEILYDTFVQGCVTDDDCIKKIFDFITEFKEEQSIDDLTVAIEDLLRI